MNHEILVKLKAEMEASKPVVKLDYEASITRFAEVAEHMTTFNRAVHSYYFETYGSKFEHDILRSLTHIMECTDQVLLTSAISKLALKLPKPHLQEFGYESDYHNELAKLTMAGIIWHTLIDTKEVNFKRETKRVEGSWQTLTTIFLGGNSTKDLLSGIHFNPGKSYQKKVEGFSLRQEHKTRLKKLSSIPFEISDVCTPEVIQKGYELKDDWNKRVDSKGNKLPEHHQTKKDRYQSYNDLICGLRGTQFYLELKYSASGRMFYKCQLEGMRPQGKLWETLMIDSAVAYEITEEQQSALKHHIYCGMERKRVSVQEALDNWTDAHLGFALKIDPMNASTDEEFGEDLLLAKAGRALSLARMGIPTKYMFGWDFTTSGLIVAGVSFRSEEMMKGGNIHTETTVYDAHTNFNDMLELGLSRKDAKKLHQPLLHGGTLKGLLSVVHDVTQSTELSMDELKERLHAAYGKCVDNITEIADWGTEAVSNTQSSLSWTLPDGFRATHKSYFQSVHNKITVVSCDDKHKSGVTSHTIVRDMPISFDNNGKPLELKSVDENGTVIPAPVKIRGLYANLTHSLDAYALRHVADGVLGEGKPIMLKHDDFMVHPSSYETILKCAQTAFNKMYLINYYQVAINEIASKSNQHGIESPTLLIGNAKNVVEDSVTFLMP